jgi:dTDP-glucose 4,6-dehydratase
MDDIFKIIMIKLLVTGGSGFIGSNFIKKCLNSSKNITVINLDAMFIGSNHKNLQNINSKNYKFVKGNICDKFLMAKLIKKVDYVVNFAAESHVDRSIIDSSAFLNSNILGVHTILEELRKNNHVKMIQISTDEVYGDIVKGSYFENDPLNPSNPYAATKAAAEMLVKSYVRTYDLDISITRCVNNYGPNQFPEKLIPKTILYASHDQSIPIHGDGKAVRQWIHVSDHCNAILKILLKDKHQFIYNIPGNYECTNLTLVKKILKIMNKTEDLIEFVPDRLGQDKRYAIQSKFIKKDLKFEPKIQFDSGISSTISWYLDHKTWWKNF